LALNHRRTVSRWQCAIGVLLFISLFVSSGTSAWGFQLPSTDWGEGGTGSTFQRVVDQQHEVLILLVVLLLLSGAVNVLLIMSLWRAREEYKEALLLVRQVDLLRDTATRLAMGRSVINPEVGDEADMSDLTGEKIEILRSGL